MIANNCVILAAGRGSRMGSETAEKPKGLTELHGRTLIEWQRDALLMAGCSEIVAVGGYRWEMLLHHLPVPYRNAHWAHSNMVASLMSADRLLSAAPCLVSYSDIAYHPSVAEKLIKCSADIAISYDVLWQDLWNLRFDDPLSDAETFRVDETGILLEIGSQPKTLEAVEGQFMGLIRFTPRGWENFKFSISRLPLETRQNIDMTSALAQLIADDIKIDTVQTAGRWVEVDSQSDRDAYIRLLASSKRWSHDWRW